MKVRKRKEENPHLSKRTDGKKGKRERNMNQLFSAEKIKRNRKKQEINKKERKKQGPALGQQPMMRTNTTNTLKGNDSIGLMKLDKRFLRVQYFYHENPFFLFFF